MADSEKTTAPSSCVEIIGFEQSIGPLPQMIGRYRVERELGKGGFGLVYLAYDDRLLRHVAIKVPHSSVLNGVSDVQAYLAEARTVASLDHRHIVPVYDVGSTPEYPCFVVSKYIDGTDLAVELKRSLLPIHKSVELLAMVADALHHAHQHGFVHRDVKPSNILLDKSSQPFVGDFGLALRDQDFGTGPRFAGTLAYMSPEQARGEGHRVDGRSDIFSLGVVFYELITGRRPFKADSRDEMVELVISVEAKPPRQLNDKIDKELERICLKAMSKRASERYSTAKDMSEDLVHFLSSMTRSGTSASFHQSRDAMNAETLGPLQEQTPFDSLSHPITIVPKGLRSFDANDAEFFLELLPGPRDRQGLPDQIRFWKTRIEESDPDKTFSIGLLYGPSGCGKSSLVRAGLLPRLANRVTAVFVESTAEETERRLLRALCKSFPTLPPGLTLPETTAVLRSGDILDTGNKVLIVLDQFEQWLHAKKDSSNTELVRALRQCDGGVLQCLVLVRDEFWLAATRFMGDLEVDLLQGRNTALADLFDRRHAKKVLAAYGRAFGALPNLALPIGKLQEQFLDQAVAGLAQDERVICVRLALFAEMVKGKQWTTETFKKIGGAEGVGVSFLEETFNSRTANPQHRLHQNAVRSVLNSLLSDSAEIKGDLRSYEELLQASGYARRPKEFADLIRILDSETRLITPSDHDGSDATESVGSETPNTKKYYQLTHDYLVPSLREWLTGKQKETRRGRAELRLAERATHWKSKPEARRLPSSWESVNICLLTKKKDWTESQRSMMSKALWLLAEQIGTVLAVFAMIALSLYYYASNYENARTDMLIESVLVAPVQAVPYAIRDLNPLRVRAIPKLNARFEDKSVDPIKRLRTAMALAEFGIVKVDFLLDNIPQSPTDEFDNLLSALDHKPQRVMESLRARIIASDERQAWHDKARQAIMAAQLGDSMAAMDMFQLRPDPVQRIALIETLAKWHGKVSNLLEAAITKDDSAYRSGLSVGLGGIPSDKISLDQLEASKKVLLDWYQHKPDSGTHSGAGWALRQWKIPIHDALQSEGPVQGRDWYVNEVGMTMLRIPCGTFTRRDIRDGAEDQSVTLTRSFWLSDREVSVGLFQQFMDDSSYPNSEKPKNWHGAELTFSPTQEHPVQQVSWFAAVQFCNWLSRKHGLTPCYERLDSEWEWAQNANGYRLPFESEWEHACRATTNTCFSCGDTLHRAYGVVQEYGAEVCAHKAPNAWGVFDAHGNVWEWCNDWFGNYGNETAVVDPMGPIAPPKTPPKTAKKRVVRGGTYAQPSSKAMSSFRETADPSRIDSPTIGIRPVRYCQ